MATTLGAFRGMAAQPAPRGGGRHSSAIRPAQPPYLKPAAALLVPRHWVCPSHDDASLAGRGSLRMIARSSDTGADGDDRLVGEQGQILQGKQEQPTMQAEGAGMGSSEEKRGDMPAQGGAPEGDRAAAGQETQLTGQPSGGDAGAQPDVGDKMPDEGGKDASLAEPGGI